MTVDRPQWLQITLGKQVSDNTKKTNAIIEKVDSSGTSSAKEITVITEPSIEFHHLSLQNPPVDQS